MMTGPWTVSIVDPPMRGGESWHWRYVDRSDGLSQIADFELRFAPCAECAVQAVQAATLGIVLFECTACGHEVQIAADMRLTPGIVDPAEPTLRQVWAD